MRRLVTGTAEVAKLERTAASHVITSSNFLNDHLAVRTLPESVLSLDYSHHLSVTGTFVSKRKTFLAVFGRTKPTFCF